VSRLSRIEGGPAQPGTVYLVGAGPGDPGLVTVRGAQLLAQADVVVHDRLSSAALLELAPDGAELADVGKQPDDRGDQDAINRLMVERAKQGSRVVRLKGGDPFVFGRGGEEALALAAAGVPYEVVPGITSAIAAPAYAGVPVTHRGLATSFTVVAGHRRSVDHPPGEGGTNWEALAAAGGTIIVLMGAAHRGRIAERLIAGGLSPSTPVSAVHWGTEPQQLTVRTTLAQLHRATLLPPVTIVIGAVASLDLDWYQRRPLLGRSVVVTRASHQAGQLSQRLRALGATVVELPAIALTGPSDGGAGLVGAVAALGRRDFSWVVFTSANAVDRFFEHVPDTRLLGPVKVAAVGPATAAALASYRVVADLVPAEHLSEGLVSEFPSAPTSGAGVLVPQAAGASPVLAEGLRRRGWEVIVVEAYRTLPQALPPKLLARARQADAICFASSSAVGSYLSQASPDDVPSVVVCIGPVTAERARAGGLKVNAEASEHTLGGLVEALERALGHGQQGQGPSES